MRCNNLTRVHSQKVPELRFEIVTVLPKNSHLQNSLFKSWVNTHVEKCSIYKHKFQWHVANTCVDTNQVQEEKMSSTSEVPCAHAQCNAHPPPPRFRHSGLQPPAEFACLLTWCKGNLYRKCSPVFHFYCSTLCLLDLPCGGVYLASGPFHCCIVFQQLITHSEPILLLVNFYVVWD